MGAIWVEAKEQRYGVILKVQLSRKLQSFFEYYVLLFHKINRVQLVKKILIMCWKNVLYQVNYKIHCKSCLIVENS